MNARRQNCNEADATNEKETKCKLPNGISGPRPGSPLAWPPGWVEYTAQGILLTLSQMPVSSWLKHWAPKLQGEPRIQWGWGWVLVNRWAVCHIGMFLSRNLDIVATGLALSSPWMAISLLAMQWVSCRNLFLYSSLGTASSSWPQSQNVRKYSSNQIQVEELT